LIGGFLFGIFYQLHPAIDRSRTALIQVSIWILGTLTLTLGVALIHGGHETGTPLAALGSVTVLAGMLLFGWLVVRREQGSPSRAMASHAD
jgi:predicted membrane channel-forming protein YqfA (hemolysin III family)